MYILIGLIVICIGLYFGLIGHTLYRISQYNFNSKQQAINYVTTIQKYITDGKKWHKIIGPYETGSQNNRVVKKLPKEMIRGEVIEIHKIPWWSFLIYKKDTVNK